MVKVALVEFGDNISASFSHALDLIGGISDLNTSSREVLVKVGVFDPRKEQHTTLPVAQAIIDSFPKAPKLWFIESDNYRGTGMERLQLWGELYSDRVVPFNLSDDPDMRSVTIAGEEMELSHLFFEERVLVSTHTLRAYEKGSAIKNLFGLLPMKKKAQYHKKLEWVLLDTFAAVGNIDLAILDGTYAYPGPGAGRKTRIPTNVIVVGRDAIAVDVVGAALMGAKPETMLIIQEAMNRGYGEGDLDNIEIVGSDFHKLQTQILKAKKNRK